MYICGGVTNCDHNTLRNLHIYGWNYGIDYSDVNGTEIGGGCQNTVIDGCHMEIIKTCVNMKAFDSSTQIFNQTIVNCNLQKGQDSTDGSPIVFIDSNGGNATNVTPVTLVNNLIFSNVTDDAEHAGVAQSNQYGVQIGTADYVSIIGGQISNCGTKAGSDGTANVYISGNPNKVIISGVDLNPLYVGANAGSSTGSTGAGASEYALLISGNPVVVQVTNCSMEGFAGSPISVTGTPGSLSITDCPGYNDQNTAINALANIATGTAYSAATQGAHGGTSYWGPSFVMFKANASGGTFQYNGGTAQTLLAGQVVCLTLASPYDTIQFNTHVPAAFTWIGK